MTHYVRVMGRLRGIDPLFQGKALGKNIDFRPTLFEDFKAKKSILDPFFRPDINFRSPFFAVLQTIIRPPQDGNQWQIIYHF